MGQRCLAEPGVGSLLPVDVEMWGALPLATRGSWYCGYLCVTLPEPCDTPGLSSRRKAVHGDSRGVLSVLAERSASLCNAPFPTAGRGGIAQGFSPVGLWLLHAWPWRVVYSSAVLRCLLPG